MLAGFFVTESLFISDYSFVKNYFPTAQIVMLLISLGTAMGGCFLLNQIKDRKSDSYNKKLFLISKGHVSLKEAYWLTFILFIISLGIAIQINAHVFTVIAAFIILTGYIYNYPPFIAKDRPVASLITNSLMGSLAFSVGWLANQTINVILFIDLIPYLAFNTALYFFTTMPDREGDKQTDKKTLAVLYGITTLIRMAFLVYSIGLIFALYSGDIRALLFMILTLPFFVLTLIKNDQASAVRTTKFGIFFFAMTVCLKAPWYLLLLIGIFIITKWYFKDRFNFNYPNFKG